MDNVNLDQYLVDADVNHTPGKIDRMIIVSRPGVGKTKALLQLPNSIYFDLENSSGHFGGNAKVVNILEIAGKNDWGPVTTIRHMTDHIKGSGKRYRFCVVDTISVIDDWAEALAFVNYKSSPAGKTFKGGSVFELDYGGGYFWHREAFKEIIECFEGIADTLILVAHVKDSSIKKSGESTSVLDIRLTGALREIMSAKQDVCAVMSFDKKEPHIRYLDFKKSEENVFMKCRVDHLYGRLVPISEITDAGEFKTHWGEIFLDLK